MSTKASTFAQCKSRECRGDGVDRSATKIMRLRLSEKTCNLYRTGSRCFTLRLRGFEGSDHCQVLMRACVEHRVEMLQLGGSVHRSQPWLLAMLA